jgi:hypothetical protein
MTEAVVADAVAVRKTTPGLCDVTVATWAWVAESFLEMSRTADAAVASTADSVR